MITYKLITVVCTLAVLLKGCLAQQACNKTIIPGRQNFTDDTGLCPAFQALRDLIPREELLNLTVLHYKCNSRFRKAVRFMQTNSFANIEQQIDQSNSYETLLNDLQENGVNTTDVATVESIFNCLMLPFSEVVSASRDCDVKCSELGRKSFIEDILDALPHDKVYDYIEESLLNANNFGAFYRTVRSDQFHEDLQSALNSRELSRPIRKLNRKHIDLPKLVSAMLTVMSWGPNAF